MNDQESGGSCLTLMVFLIEGACRAQALFLEKSFVSLNSLECMLFVLGKDFLLETRAVLGGTVEGNMVWSAIRFQQNLDISHRDSKLSIWDNEEKIKVTKIKNVFHETSNVFVFI